MTLHESLHCYMLSLKFFYAEVESGRTSSENAIKILVKFYNWLRDQLETEQIIFDFVCCRLDSKYHIM